MNKKIYVIILLLVLFILNTVLVMTGNTVALDDAVHNFVRFSDADVVDKIFKCITFFGSTKFMILLSVGMFIIFMIYKKKKYAFSTASMIILSTIANNVIKIIVRRSRPEYITVVEKSFSYPSGHTMASVTLYGFFIYLIQHSNLSKALKNTLTVILSILIIGVASSRIYLGAHYFTDIYGAFLVSMIILFTFAVIDDKKKIIKD